MRSVEPRHALGSRPADVAGSNTRQGSLFGLTLVSGEQGDIRQTPGGLSIYGDNEVEEIAIPVLPSGRDILLDEAYAAVHGGIAPAHDGRWGMANLEVCLAAIQSARERREVMLHHQVPTPD